MRLLLLLLLALYSSCAVRIQTAAPAHSITGSAFYQQAAAMNTNQRDSLSLHYLLSGNIPDLLRRFVSIHTSFRDSLTGRITRGTYYVAPDYLSIGTKKNWARIHLSAFAAQRMADSLQCLLPTRKMVDQIYTQARVKLEPVPMYALRDSTPTFFHHHLIVEGQRKGRKGLIAGIQKDIVTTGKLYQYPKHDRVAIYGWHKPDGKPIQPLYTGHAHWYVDYSQGVRLVYHKMKVNGKWIPVREVLQDPIKKQLICDEPDCGNGRYPSPQQ
jgi:hypothetical protein